MSTCPLARCVRCSMAIESQSRLLVWIGEGARKGALSMSWNGVFVKRQGSFIRERGIGVVRAR